MLVRRSCMPLRRMRSIAGLILFACAASVLHAPVRAQNPCPTPATCGAWEGPWDWTAQVPYAPPPTAGCAAPEFSHAAVLPTGSHQGKVLLWRFGSVWTPPAGPCFETLHTSFWLFDPALQQGANGKLARLSSSLAYDIFCSGLSWDRNGELVVAGGTREYGGNTPSRTFKFRPTSLGAYYWDAAGNPFITESLSSPPWIELVSMRLARFYPIVFHLLFGVPFYGTGLTGTCTALDTSSTMVLGGPEQGAQSPPPSPPAPPQPTANKLWELLGPDATTSTPWSCAFRPPASHLPAPYDVYALGNPAPETDLDTYPHVYQLTNRRLFVAFDVNTVEWPGAIPSAVPNTPGRSWALFPRYDTGAQQQWELHRGPAALQPEGADPSGDRHYAPCVLIHKRGTTAGKKDRLVTFGGSYDANFFTASPYGSAPSWVVRDSVQEFEPQGANAPATGQWRDKATMSVPRLYHCAIVLPTGQVLLVNGTLVDPGHLGAPSQDPVPVFQPEIYDIGVDPSSSGSTSGLLAQSNGVLSTPPGTVHPIPRLYHSLAVLLPDGRVLVTGGRYAEHSSITYANSAYSGELYSPPYLFQGFRPTLSGVPNQASFAGTITLNATITTGNVLEGFVLLRPAALTHHFDPDQRYIELEAHTILQTRINGSSTTYSVSVPAPTSDLGPQGWYMLYAIETNGIHRVPSIAAFVQIL